MLLKSPLKHGCQLTIAAHLSPRLYTWAAPPKTNFYFPVLSHCFRNLGCHESWNSLSFLRFMSLPPPCRHEDFNSEVIATQNILLVSFLLLQQIPEIISRRNTIEGLFHDIYPLAFGLW